MSNLKCKLIFLLLSGLSCIPNCGNLHTEGEEICAHFVPPPELLPTRKSCCQVAKMADSSM